MSQISGKSGIDFEPLLAHSCQRVMRGPEPVDSIRSL
jgi:hypothetical protein